MQATSLHARNTPPSCWRARKPLVFAHVCGYHQRMPNAEINAVNLADEYADEAIKEIRQGVTNAEAKAITNALLSLGARLDALRETLNRELPDLREAVENMEATGTAP